MKRPEYELYEDAPRRSWTEAATRVIWVLIYIAGGLVALLVVVALLVPAVPTDGGATGAWRTGVGASGGDTGARGTSFMPTATPRPRPTPTPTFTVEQLASRAIEVSYEDLARFPERYEGRLVHVTGEVIQRLEGDDGSVNLRVSITEDDGWWSDPVLVWWQDADVVARRAGRILEDDIVDIVGYSKGLITYDSLFDQKITVPFIQALHVRMAESDD
jgi:hypothetical protein